MNSEKYINSSEITKRLGHLIIYRTVGFFSHSFNNFSTLLLCKIHGFDIFNMVDFFQIFVTSRISKILTVSNFWLGVYPQPYVKHQF